MTSQRIQRLLDDRTLEAADATDDEIGGFWRSALRFYADSSVRGLSPEAAFYLAYQTGMSAATALVRAAGYRVKAKGRHHYATFYVVQALGDPELTDLAFALDSFRSDRHDAVYDFEEETDRVSEQLQGIRALLAEFMPLAHDRLVRSHAALAKPEYRFTPQPTP